MDLIYQIEYTVPAIKHERSGGGGCQHVATTVQMLDWYQGAKDGSPKILENCDLPLTGLGVVNRIITDLAVLDITETGVELVELAPDISIEHLQNVTGCALQVDRFQSKY